ncbi:hypothetical protein C8R41DRAFT_582822 [Lentinula lateritia]|uniref:Uncharacterized protein n=1 Tax=Lentinula lateritia TaxID=40482 RepID=A0ABQ8V884_9AGAR|nr:hypothetical protein C8R41DRAFT_582822 [Lentinula lateritia]
MLYSTCSTSKSLRVLIFVLLLPVVCIIAVPHGPLVNIGNESTVNTRDLIHQRSPLVSKAIIHFHTSPGSRTTRNKDTARRAVVHSAVQRFLDKASPGLYGTENMSIQVKSWGKKNINVEGNEHCFVLQIELRPPGAIKRMITYQGWVSWTNREVSGYLKTDDDAETIVVEIQKNVLVPSDQREQA